MNLKVDTLFEWKHKLPDLYWTYNSLPAASTTIFLKMSDRGALSLVKLYLFIYSGIYLEYIILELFGFFFFDCCSCSCLFFCISFDNKKTKLNLVVLCWITTRGKGTGWVGFRGIGGTTWKTSSALTSSHQFAKTIPSPPKRKEIFPLLVH